MRIGYLEIKWDSRRGKVLKKLKEKGSIPAIKLIRDLTGWGLRESKEYVDHIRLVERLDVQGKKITEEI